MFIAENDRSLIFQIRNRFSLLIQFLFQYFKYFYKGKKKIAAGHPMIGSVQRSVVWEWTLLVQVPSRDAIVHWLL